MSLHDIAPLFIASLKFDDSVIDAASAVRSDSDEANWYDLRIIVYGSIRIYTILYLIAMNV